MDLSFLGLPSQIQQTGIVIGEVLDRMLALARAHDFELGVVYLPSRWRLFEGRWVVAPEREWSLNGFYEEVRALCVERGIPITDATRRLRERLDEGELVVNPIFDQHSSSSGMRAIADEISLISQDPGEGWGP